MTWFYTGVPALGGNHLVAAITSVCAAGFLLFGYDQGVMSGVIIAPAWLAAMGQPSTLVTSTLVAVYDVGALVGALLAAATAERLGRKRALLVGAGAVLAGALVMGTSFGRAQFVVGRLGTGVGIGFVTAAAPVYVAEVATARGRGWRACALPTTMLAGLALAYWINYACYFRPGAFRWRFPLLFQAVFALYVLLLLPCLPETPRWLMRKDGAGRGRGAAGSLGGEGDMDVDRGTVVLAKLRGAAGGVADAKVREERDEILAALGVEAAQEGGWGDLFRDGGVAADKRFYLALGIQFMQQMSGINIVTYYAPTLFQESLGMDEKRALFLGCWLQVFYFFASFLTWIIIDRIGRRKLFIGCAIGMTVVLVLEAACVAVGTRGAAVVAVVMVFAFEAFFTWGWMATVWIYPPEILPLKIRGMGASLAAASDFLGNFIVVEITPPALQNIGWRTYVIFAVLNLVNAAVVWALYPETAGVPLESVDGLFVTDDQAPTGGDGAGVVVASGRRRLQWAVVPRANARRRERGRALKEPTNPGVDLVSGSPGGRAEVERKVGDDEEPRAFGVESL